MMLCYEHALMELSVMIHEASYALSPQPEKSNPRDCVQRALSWYSQHMQENPNLPDICKAVHVSPAHLRRLFHESLQMSPKQMFDQIRFQRAMKLLSDTDTKLSTIAASCGFEDQSAFSRAFKNRFKCSPRNLRQMTT